MQKIALSALSQFAQEVLAQAARIGSAKESATILALRGDLGAGKTTFTQALARALGIEEPVQSPTYVLMKSYPLSRPGMPFSALVHIDAYRLEEPEQFRALKPDTFLDNKKNLVGVEWPERAQGVLPTPDLTINFSSEGASEGERFVEIE